MARTSTAGAQAELYLRILSLIPRHRGVTVDDIMHGLSYLGVETELLTVQRALKVLRESPVYGIECDKTAKPYVYRMGPGDAFAMCKLSAEQSLLLQLVEDHFMHQLPTSLAESLEPMFTKAHEVLEDRVNGRERDWAKKVAVVPNALTFLPPVIHPDIFDTVSEALYRDLRLKIDYVDIRGRAKEVFVDPLALVKQAERLYLVARYVVSGEFRHLALHRMKHVEIVEQRVNREGFDLDAYLAEKPFNYAYGDFRHIRLEFAFTSDRLATTLTETPFNETQILQRFDDGSYKVKVDIDDSMLLTSWLNTWGEREGIHSIVKTPI